jgi:phage repressor protein C with HTH and peptisase S24 domain
MSTVGERLEQEIERIGGVSAIAKNLGVVRNTVYNWQKKENIPSSGLMKLEAMGADVSFILSGERARTSLPNPTKPIPSALPGPTIEDDFIYVPRFDLAVHAGAGAICEVDEIRDRLAFRRDWIREMGLQANRLALVDVRGDSMEPTLSEGDVLLVALGEEIREDGIYVLNRDGGVIVKRLQTTITGELYIRSDNPRYAEERVPKFMLEHVRVAGRAVWLGRRI